MQLVVLALSFPSLPSLLLPFKLLLSPPHPLLSLSTCRDVSVIGTTTLSLAGLKDQELKDIVLKLKMRCDADIFCHHFRSTEHSFMTIASHLSFLLSHSLSLSFCSLSLSLSLLYLLFLPLFIDIPTATLSRPMHPYLSAVSFNIPRWPLYATRYPRCRTS